MPETATGIIAVRDAVVAAIAAYWNPTAPDAVTGVTRLNSDLAKELGRRVRVFAGLEEFFPVTRRDDQNTYMIPVWTLERYAGKGELPDAWVTERVTWIEQLTRTLGNRRGPNLLAVEGQRDSGLWCESVEIVSLYDHEDLAELKAFSSVFVLTYREQRGI